MAVQRNLRKMHPLQLTEIMLFCQNIKEIGAEKISRLEKPHQVFLSEFLDDDGKEYHEINWEFILFESTNYQREQLLQCFVVRPKEEPKSNIIQSPSSEGERPDLIV